MPWRPLLGSRAPLPGRTVRKTVAPRWAAGWSRGARSSRNAVWCSYPHPRIPTRPQANRATCVRGQRLSMVARASPREPTAQAVLGSGRRRRALRPGGRLRPRAGPGDGLLHAGAGAAGRAGRPGRGGRRPAADARRSRAPGEEGRPAGPDRATAGTGHGATTASTPPSLSRPLAGRAQTCRRRCGNASGHGHARSPGRRGSRFWAESSLLSERTGFWRTTGRACREVPRPEVASAGPAA